MADSPDKIDAAYAASGVAGPAGCGRGRARCPAEESDHRSSQGRSTWL